MTIYSYGMPGCCGANVLAGWPSKREQFGQDLYEPTKRRLTDLLATSRTRLQYVILREKDQVIAWNDLLISQGFQIVTKDLLHNGHGNKLRSYVYHSSFPPGPIPGETPEQMEARRKEAEEKRKALHEKRSAAARKAVETRRRREKIHEELLAKRKKEHPNKYIVVWDREVIEEDKRRQAAALKQAA